MQVKMLKVLEIHDTRVRPICILQLTENFGMEVLRISGIRRHDYCKFKVIILYTLQSVTVQLNVILTEIDGGSPQNRLCSPLRYSSHSIVHQRA